MSDVNLLEPLSQADYAKHRGVSRQAISKAVAAGKIPTLEDGKIDAVAADHALGESILRLDEPDEAPPSSPSAPGEGAALTRARTASEEYRVRLFEIELAERERRLVPVDEIRQALEQVAGTLARGLDLWPTAADDVFAAGTRGGPDATRQAMTVQRDEVLRRLMADMNSLMAAGSTPRPSAGGAPQ